MTQLQEQVQHLDQQKQQQANQVQALRPVQGQLQAMVEQLQGTHGGLAQYLNRITQGGPVALPTNEVQIVLRVLAKLKGNPLQDQAAHLEILDQGLHPLRQAVADKSVLLLQAEELLSLEEQNLVQARQTTEELSSAVSQQSS